MTKQIPRLLSLIAINLIFSLSTNATEPREITWDDLVPAEAQFDDVFTRLDEDQLYELSMVADLRDRLADGQEIDEQTMRNHEARIKDLQEQGVDVDGLIAMREEVARQRVAKTFLANKALNGQSIRMPGYLLPLEFDGDRATEFFLVPYVGACIHTPPPPPNQIVHVKTKDGYSTDGGLYSPVWVNGVLKAEQGEAELDYVDGISSIPSAYKIDAIKVEPYE